MTKPMTPEMLQEIQEFPDSMGMGHLVREVERCWEELSVRYVYAGKGEPAPFELDKEIDGCKKRHAVLVAKHESNVIELTRLREQVEGMQMLRNEHAEMLEMLTVATNWMVSANEYGELLALITRIEATQKGGVE